MKDHLRDLLSPADDGRGFTDAVLLRASGALARRRQAVEDEPLLGWLGQWARPWLVAALFVVAVAGIVPAMPGEPAEGAAAVESTTATEYPVLATTLPEDVIALAVEPRE
jgi:hypothetical protein